MDHPPSEVSRSLFFSKTGEALACLLSPRLDDERVHAARKALKGARAALRLLRPRLGETIYSCENIALRDAARDLSPLRDARSVLEALDLIDSEGRRRKDVRAAIARQRSLLQAHLIRAQEDFHANPAALNHCKDCVRECRQRMRIELDEPGDVRRSIERFGRIYRRARNAHRRAACVRSDDALHEWRKQTKHLLTAAEVLGDTDAKWLRGIAKLAHRIADRLGDDHDLSVLRQTLSDPAGENDATLLFPLIEGRRFRLQSQALRLGRKMFVRNPRRVAARAANSTPATPTKPRHASTLGLRGCEPLIPGPSASR
jgi:CHAD domain-containing protein